MGRILNIAMDVRPLATPHGGIHRYTRNLVREFVLQQYPHNVFLYSDWPFQCDFPLPANWKVRYVRHRLRGMSTAFAQVVFPIWALIDRIDVFWSPRHQLPLLLSPKIRTLLTIHDVVWKRFPQTMRRGGRLAEALLTPLSVRKADGVIAVSQFTCSEIAAVYPYAKHKVRVVYEASALKMDEAQTSPPFISDYFLFVGSSEPRKNLKRLLEGYIQYFHSKENPSDLVIVGADQWGSFNPAEFICKNNLESHVHLLSNIDDDSLSNLYAHARACIMVSLYEGFGLPLVEAMQFGIPLIVSADSALAEIAADAALLVDPYNIDAIAEALHRLSESEDVRLELSRSATRRGRQFSWTNAASETMALMTNDSCADS